MIIPVRTVDGHPYMYPKNRNPALLLPAFDPPGADPDTVASDDSGATMVRANPARDHVVDGETVYSDLPALVFPIVPAFTAEDVIVWFRYKWTPTELTDTGHPTVGEPGDVFSVDIHRRWHSADADDVFPDNGYWAPRYWDFGWYIGGFLTPTPMVPPPGTWQTVGMSILEDRGASNVALMVDFLTNPHPDAPSLLEEPFVTPVVNYDVDVWLSQVWIEIPGVGPSPLRVYPRADGLTASAQRTYPSTRARSGARITGYY